jgi:hypothetical protein
MNDEAVRKAAQGQPKARGKRGNVMAEGAEHWARALKLGSGR